MGEVTPVLRDQLRGAVAALGLRGLRQSAKWAAEQLKGLSPEAGLDFEGHGELGEGPDAGLPKEAVEALRLGPADVSDSYLLAKTFYDIGEYQRAASALDGGVAGTANALAGLSCEEVFIKAYSLFLAGEKIKEQEILEINDPLERSSVENPNIRKLSKDLTELYHAARLDGFGLYMYAVVLRELAGSSGVLNVHRLSPFSVLCEAVVAFPWNWSAWLDLATIVVQEQRDIPEDMPLPKSAQWIHHFFVVHCFIELGSQHHCETALELLHDLEATFPQSNYLLGQLGLANYNLRKFQAAEENFEELRHRDPYRLDNMDTYSNILYVKESKAALSHLAHVAMKNDKYRPETCCIVGNYYSLKSQHERAVLYFQRALKLNRKFLAAWTLMGHEFVEMKNTGAAIEAYRRGVDVNPRDYRAWYGLGQTYEILTMFHYALFYYRKAVKLRPTDARMWCALGNCYKLLERYEEAIACFERAARHHDQEGIALIELARLYQDRHRREHAAESYRAFLSSRDGDFDKAPGDAGVAEALEFLVEFHRANGELALAAKYCSRMLECGGAKEEWAKEQLKLLQGEHAAAAL